MGKWVFEELRGAAVRRDPTEAELFKTEQTAEGEYAGNDALVREVIQNSLDARTGDGPVRLRIAIHEAGDAPPPSELAHYFARLRQPLAARQVEYNGSATPRLQCRFLVCEDFGTRGLEGDTLLFRDPPPQDPKRQDFYWFWRNIGRSGKTGDDLGRWGLGKTVYRAASRVGCMFGLTVRQSDSQPLLMGQAVLQTHELDGNTYAPEGYWCGGQNHDDLPLPIVDDSELRIFRDQWRLIRTTEPGLSVVSPYVHPELKADRLLQAVAVHFFTRIIRGELVVEVVGPGVHETLDQAGIEAACKRIVWDGPKRTKRHASPPVAFAKACLKATPLASRVLGRERMPEFDDKAFAEDELAALRSHYAAGELVSVRVRLWLPQRLDKGSEGHVDVHLRKLSDGPRLDAYYVREGMTITKLNSRAALRGVQAFVLVDPGPLAELLGDTEGPAHEDWQTSAERPDREWRTWKGRVLFVRKIIDHLIALLTPRKQAPDFDLLSDFFSISRREGEQRRPKPGKESEDGSEVDPIPSTPKWFHITQRAGGFTVGRTTGVPMPENPALRVSVAYDIPRGDPIRIWHPLDFQIAMKDGDPGLRPKGSGLKGQRPSGNMVRLNIEENDFNFSLGGFDQNRDLFVRVDDISNTAEATT